MAELPLANPPIGPLGLLGDVPVPSIEARTEEQYFSDINTPTGLKPIQPGAATPAPSDPFAGFQDANFDQFQDAPDEFANFQTADDLDLKSVEDLDKDRENFRPADYFSSNPDVANDPKKLQKLLEVYRRRDEEGLTAKGVAQSAITQTPGLIGDIAGGVKRLGERAIDVVLQPTANVVLGTLTGDLFDDQKRAALFNETRKTIRKGVSEVGAGSEAATVGLVDLARTGSRKVASLPGIEARGGIEGIGINFPGEKVEARKPKSDQELLAQLSDDASFRQLAEAAMRGEGEAAKIAGLDKETLAKQGIEIDEKAIAQLSLVDPITMVATGGAFRIVGAGGKILGTARTLVGAEKLTEGLSKIARTAAGRTLQGAGKLTTLAGKELRGSGAPLATIAGVSTAVSGAGIPASIVTGAGVKMTGKAARFFGPKLEELGKGIAERSGSVGVQKVMDLARAGTAAATAVGEGAVTGIAAASPFAIAADEDATAGALFGAGAALGAGGAVGAGAFRVVKNSASRRYFGENRPVLPDVASPSYGFDAALDSQHEANISKLSVQDASELKNFREALRQQGGEIYAVDQPTFRQKVAEEYRTRTGQEIDPALLDTYEKHSAFFDQSLGDRKVVYLNSDITGLQHDAGHIFDAVLSPERRAELRTAVEQAFTPEQRQAFRETYERRVGSKISDTAAVDEFIAEQFSALFNNVPVTELNAPKSLLNKFIDVAAEGAEALGIDLSAGATTPNLGAPVSVGIRQLFRNAAGEVMRANIEGVPATKIIAPDFGGTPPPPAPAPTPRAPSRPIRPSGTDLPTPVTPEARVAAAARFAETGIEQARLNAASDPAIARAVEEVSVHMEAGNPVLEVDHLGVVSEGTPDSPEGRTSRRATQAAGYEALKGELSRAGAPADLVASHLKTFVPVRWTQQGGTPTLVAMSLDKALQNIQKLGSDPKAAALIPYPTENGKLTAQGWRDAVADLKAYAENQANGRRGDGGRLTVPEAGELSIPAENPAYTPQPLSPEKANFANLVQGLKTPDTARAKKGKTPGNVKGQLLAEANLRPTETPARIAPTRAGKQAFVEFPGRTVQEVNPLRNRLKEAGSQSVGELIEVTERIRAIDIERVTPRPDISFKAPVTDIIRGGFQPAPTEFRQKNLGGRTVEEFSDYILKASPEEWKAATDNMTGGLTGGAWNLGLGLKEAADVRVLKAFQDKLSDATKAAMKSGDFDGAYSLVSKGQFFREAHEAATGTGSAGAAFKRGQMGTSGVTPPFPTVEKTQATAAAAPDSTTITIGEGGAQFLPAEELAIGTADSRPPELRVLPAAPGGRPPTEPPVLRPPPVAAGFLPAEELQPEETPEVRVLPAAPGGRPPTDSPAVRPPPVAAGVARDDEAAGFQPRTESGRKLEERGFEIVPSGELGIRRVAVTKDGQEVAVIQSVQRSPQRAEISMVQKIAGAPKGVGEVLYREIGSQLRDDGVTELSGQVVAPEPLAIRKKIFGDFASIDINGEPATFEQAVATAERIRGVKPEIRLSKPDNEVAAIEPVNTISEATRFSPGQPDMNFIRQGDAAKRVQELERERRRIISELPSVQEKDREGLEARLSSVNREAEAAWSEFSQSRAGFAPGRRDAQGRPLKKNGDIDYPKWQAEGLAARKKQRAESDRAEPLKEVGPLVDEVEQTKLTGWILPDKTFVPLDTNFHEQYLAQNAADLNKKFGTEFTPDESSVDERLAALNAGFVRLRNQNGQLRVEVNAGKFRSVKSKLMNVLQDREGQIDGLTVSLLNDQGVEVDSTSAARLHELSGPEKFDKISEAIDSLRGAGFQPAGEGLPGIGVPSVEEAGRARAARRISSVKKNNPEAVVPQYARDEDGQVIVKPDGDPKTVTLDYNFIETPLAREAAKGLKGAAREEAATAAVGEKLVDLFKSVEKNPDITAGAKWYSTARTRLKKVFGDDSKFFAELLGATSARTPVDINYRFALDAYNQFKSGEYDKVLAKYREGKTKWDTQDIGDFLKATKAEEPTRGQFLDWWVDKHDLGVTQSNGKKFGMNSRAVLRVLDGSWASEVQGPKTPNFAGNLTGETFEATVDVWAARTLSRMASEGGKNRWRILPENETGVSDRDFYFGQAAYRHAAKKLGIKPDALQAVLWFAEKQHWEERNWTRGAGAEKSDFNVLLNETERTPEGSLRMKSPQSELGLDN